MPSNWPQFNPEPIADALFTLLQGAQYTFNLMDRRGALPQNVTPANQPYLGLIETGMSQVENQAQGLEKWLIHFKVVVYLRADAKPQTVPATAVNAAIQAIVQQMRSAPPGERQRLGGLVDNAWIDGPIMIDTGIIDQQCAILIPITVVCGI